MEVDNLMSDEYVSRNEHEEFVKRLDDNAKQLSDRIDRIERQNNQITDLLVLVNKLASSMEHMMKEQDEQGKRLEKLESKDGEMWRKFLGYVISGIVGIAVALLFATK